MAGHPRQRDPLPPELLPAPAFADIKATPTDRWVLIEDIGSFQFEGTKVFAAPDFGYWNAADRLQLVD